MASRKRRYLGCLGVIVALAALLLLVNFALSLYYRHQSALVAREMAKKGYPATYRELVATQNSTSPGQHNGADDLLAAFSAFKDEGVNYDLTPVSAACVLPPSGEPIPSVTLAEMDKFISINRETLRQLKSAASAGTYRLPIHSPKDWEHDLLDQANGLTKCSRLLSVEAVYFGEKGDADASLDAVETLIRLAESFACQPSVIAYLNGMAILSMGPSTGRVLIERGYFKEAHQLERLAAIMEVARHSDAAYASWTDALISRAGQYAEPLPRTTFQQVLGAVHPMDKVKDFVTPYVVAHTFLNELDHFNEKCVALMLSKSLDEPLLAGIRTMDGAASDEFLSWIYLRPSGAMVSESLPEIEGHERARLRLAATAAHAVRYRIANGRLPEPKSFEEEVMPPRDPIDGKLLRYRKTDTGFRVWGVGRNGVDDGGFERGEQKGADDEVVEIRLPK